MLEVYSISLKLKNESLRVPQNFVVQRFIFSTSPSACFRQCLRRVGLAALLDRVEGVADRLLAAVDCRLEQEEIGRDEDAGEDRQPDNRGSKPAEGARAGVPSGARRLSWDAVAKDTEKLIRQLSLISFLMAQGRPVSALEIKREVEGYSDMNDDAFARRFYADRAELESLGIQLGVEKPGEGFFEAELYSLPPENFYLDAISFDDAELAALSTALLLLTDGGFAYAEPLRLALQQVAWGHPEPAGRGRARAPVEMAMTASRRRPRPLAAAVEDRDRDLAPQDDRVHLLHDGARRHLEAQGRPLPPGLPRRPVLFDRLLARARGGARLPPLPDPGQGRLRDQGRARLLAARGLRPPRLRQPRRLAAGGDPGHGEDLDPRADRLADRARLRRLRRRSATPKRPTRRRARARSSKPSTPRTAS